MKIYNYQNNANNSEPTNKLLKSIKDNLLHLNYYLKNHRHRATNINYLNEKSWFILYGPKSSGKTSFLRNSEINFLQGLNQDDPYCTTWITENAVYFDICGDASSDKQLSCAWEDIFKQFATARRNPIDGILFTLNLSELLSQSKLQREALINDHISILSNNLRAKYYRIPIYLCFTSFDCIHGFNAYFEDLTQEGRHQSCGFMLPKKSDQGTLFERISRNTDKLLSVINHNIIKRLHQTSQLQKKSLIYDFPLHFEQHKSTVLDTIKILIKHIPHNQTIYLRGIFFCSNTQQYTDVNDKLNASISQTFSLQLTQPQPFFVSSRSFFSYELLNTIFPNDPGVINNHYLNQNVSKKSAIAAVFLGSFLTIGLLTHSFIYDVDSINVASKSLFEYKSLKEEREKNKALDNLMRALDILEIADSKLNLNKIGALNLFPFSNINNVKKQIHQTYQSALQQELLPALAHYIDGVINKTDYNQASQLYAALKAYLMLGNPQHMQAEYFQNWLDEAWKNDPSINNEQRTRLRDDLKPLLSNQLPAIELNLNTINEIRVILNALPKSLVAYLTLQSAHPNKASVPFTHMESQLLKYKYGEIHIPYIYTKKAFATIYAEQIPKVSKAIMHGDWVLGRNQLLNSATKQSHVELTQKLQHIYIKDYINWWNNLLDAVNIASTDDPENMSSIIDNLSAPDSVIFKLSRLVEDNTSPYSAHGASHQLFNETVSQRFISYHDTNLNTVLVKSQLALLAKDLWKLDNSSDSDQEAYEQAVLLFSSPSSSLRILREQAEQAPPAIKRLLYQVTDNTWNILESHTRNFINSQYYNAVYSEYTNNILSRYPFNKSASDEVTYVNFNHFFGPSGTLNQFFHRYIQPFTNTSNANWQPRVLHGLSFALNDKVMEQFIRANVIRKMFFNDQDTAQIAFNLEPLSYDDDVKDMIINIYGKKVFDYQGSKRITKFTWPSSSELVSITMETTKGEQFQAEKRGPWALFRILDKSNLAPDEDMEHFDLTFVLNDHISKYRLTAEDTINPFVPGILENFSLPEKL